MWQVRYVALTSDARKWGAKTHYKWHVEGINTETGAEFSWSVPSLDNPAYDLSRAVVDPAIKHIFADLYPDAAAFGEVQ